jgi:pimeloyl-ACP methyl ester carboxylesterase
MAALAAATFRGVGIARILLLVPLLVLALGSGCRDGSHRPTLPRGSAPRFELGRCEAQVPEGAQVECGTLIVAEDRGAEVSHEVRIAVAIFRSGASAPDASPAVFLPGGPGDGGLDRLDYLYGLSAPVRARRDLIVLDYRGVGRSSPSLVCTEGGGDEGERIERCRERFERAPVDLTAYSSADIARDLADLRTALGVPSLHLIGSSYGTRVGLTMLRDFPEVVGSASLDAVAPPEVDLFETAPLTFDRAFTRILESCAADATCAGAFPSLAQDLDVVLERLATHPPDISFTVDGQPQPAVLDRSLFIGLLLRAFTPALLGTVPAIIHATAIEDYAPLIAFGELAPRTGTRYPFAFGMHLSVQCAEEVPFSSAADAEAISSAHPRFAFISAYRVAAERCEHWAELTVDPREDEPVASNEPVLFLSGDFDPLLDPAWAEDARASLPTSIHLPFPNAAHGVLHTDCGWQAVSAFIDAPDELPTHPCAAEASPPPFVVDPGPLLREMLEARP